MGEARVGGSTHRQGRLEFLDGIRGVAAFLVVIEHTAEAWVPGYTQWSIDTVNIGRVGIVAFFMVSGYVIGLTLSHQTVRTFAIRRFWRLYPIYWLATIIWVLVDLPNTDPSSSYSLFVIAVNVTMLQGAIPGLVGILGPAWTLGAELVFYVQTAVAKQAKVLRASVYLGYVWLALCGVMALSNATRQTTYTAIVPLMLFFASFGYSLYLRDQGRSRAWIGFAASVLVVVPALSVPLLSSQATTDLAWGRLGFNLSHVVGVVLFLGFLALRARAVHPVVLWLGSISYALYLAHASVIEVVRQAGAPTAVAFPVVIVASLLVAWVLHRVVEVPSIRLGRRLSAPDAGGPVRASVRP